MPGFNIGNGGGANEPRNVAETRRKHRWTFEVIAQGVISREAILFLQKATRPSFKYEEAIMHHDQEQAHFAGKQSWEPCQMAWYDAEQSPDVSDQIAKWLQTVTTGGLGEGGGQVSVAVPSDYKKEANLTMTNGAGQPTERWAMKGVWPMTVNWGDLDYTNTEIQLIEVTMRFDRAIRTKV